MAVRLPRSASGVLANSSRHHTLLNAAYPAGERRSRRLHSGNNEISTKLRFPCVLAAFFGHRMSFYKRGRWWSQASFSYKGLIYWNQQQHGAPLGPVYEWIQSNQCSNLQRANLVFPAAYTSWCKIFYIKCFSPYSTDFNRLLEWRRSRGQHTAFLETPEHSIPVYFFLGKQDEEMFTVSSLSCRCHHCLAVPSDCVSLVIFCY